MSHQHSFVGNRTTNAFTTVDSLLAGGTTCRRAADRAAYWMPTLFVDGRAVQPAGATVYYRRRTAARVQAFPAGLKMIAGNSSASSPQGLRVTFWNCGAQNPIPPSAAPPTCPNALRDSLRLHVSFPSCWDGKNLDSADHKSHMAYPDGRSCPASHPVSVPALAVIFRYPTTGGQGVTLASGGVYSAHADFFNGWETAELTKLVNFCLNGMRHCGAFGPS
jgi:hypothetical protein